MANKIGLYPVPILLTEDMTDYEGFARYTVLLQCTRRQ